MKKKVKCSKCGVIFTARPSRTSDPDEPLWPIPHKKRDCKASNLCKGSFLIGETVSEQ